MEEYKLFNKEEYEFIIQKYVKDLVGADKNADEEDIVSVVRWTEEAKVQSVLLNLILENKIVFSGYDEKHGPIFKKTSNELIDDIEDYVNKLFEENE